MTEQNTRLRALIDKWLDSARFLESLQQDLPSTKQDIVRFRHCAAEVDEILRASAPALPGKEQWQPITTAPKDGSKIIAWHDEGVDLCWWEDAHADGVDDMGHDAGWFGVAYSAPSRSFGNPKYVHEAQGQPTHWMPLSPPTVRENPSDPGPKDLLLAWTRVESQKAVALALGVSPQYLCDVLAGRRDLSATLARALGYERVVTFSRLTESPDRSVAVDPVARIGTEDATRGSNS